MMMTARVAVVVAGLATLCNPAVAQEAQAAPQPQAAPAPRPKYKPLRFEEDWSVLAGEAPGRPVDLWDPIKYVPLGEDGTVWASFGGQVRARAEGWSNFAFRPEADDSFQLWRFLLHGDVHLGKSVRIFVEGKSALSSERDLPGGRRTLDVDTIDLEQAFADLRLDLGQDSLTIRPGRQALLFGKHRLVSPLDWSNTLRRWDGVSAILRHDPWTVHGFWSQFAPVQKYDFNDPDAQTQFFGVYANGPVCAGGPGLDLYFLGLDKDDGAAFNGTTGPEERFTAGGRLSGDVGGSGVDYDVEGAYQFGEVGAGDVDAWMLGAELGWKAAEWWSAPRFWLGLDFGSGDDEPGGDVETFNQLFPLGHAFLGYADLVGRQNVRDLSLGVTLAPMAKLTVAASGHLFWRDSTRDALYDAGGNVLRAGSLGSSREIGQEIDVTATWRFDAHMVALFGYSHFFAGDFIQESGSSSDVDFAYVQLQYTF